jgi:hypothetical protein
MVRVREIHGRRATQTVAGGSVVLEIKDRDHELAKSSTTISEKTLPNETATENEKEGSRSNRKVRIGESKLTVTLTHRTIGEAVLLNLDN